MAFPEQEISNACSKQTLTITLIIISVMRITNNLHGDGSPIALLSHRCLPDLVAQAFRVRPHEMGRSDVKKRFSEEQIIGFLREAELGSPVKELCCIANARNIRRALRVPVCASRSDEVTVKFATCSKLRNSR